MDIKTGPIYTRGPLPVLWSLSSSRRQMPFVLTDKCNNVLALIGNLPCLALGRLRVRVETSESIR